MNAIGLVVHTGKREALAAAERLRTLAEAIGLIVLDAPGDRSAEAVVSLGGDGTTLRAARIAHERDVPLLGFNLGRLGFLTGLDISVLEAAIGALAEDRYEVSERMMLLAGDFEGEERRERLKALNEIVLEKQSPSRVIRIGVTVDGELLGTFTADGFIVATPTGSTAYSLSAGGPVLEPTLDALVLTPVSAHYPLWRSSVVTGGHHTVELEVIEGNAMLSADGEPLSAVSTGERVWAARDPRPLKVAVITLASLAPRSPAGGFFEKLRVRFGLDPGREPG